jgi:para-nitrobenzyl esterase
VRKADKFGDVCPQLHNPGAEPMSEDCLVANVWTGAASSSERRPVLVWVHGGGFGAESGSLPKLDGEALARKGVDPGDFQLSPGPARLPGDARTQQGVRPRRLGQLWPDGRHRPAAVGEAQHRRVRRRSGQGDVVRPFRRRRHGQFPVDLADGQGALQPGPGREPGALARDLELRYLSSSWREKSKAEKDGAAYVEKLGAKSLADLRALPWRSLLLETPNTEVEVYTGGTGRPPLFRPVIDGYVLPHTFSQAFALKAQNP